MTRFFTVSTAGHVDHGKTSLIRALTGIDPDRLKEEKERQMTTDLGFAHLKLPDDIYVGFVDVPGHGKFLKNMLAGVGGIDMALLVVAADEGPMPQTWQHVRILSLLGVRKALVALTKIDVVQDAEHISMVRSEIERMLDAHGVNCLDILPVSATKALGLDELKSALQKELNSFGPRDTTGGAFLPIDRVFTKSGFGTVITGTLVRGQLKTGDQITVGPDVTTGRVRKLETFGKSVESVNPGQRVAANVVLKDSKAIGRGDVILTNDVPSTKTLIVTLIDKPRVAGDKFIQQIADHPIRLYHGTGEFHGNVRWAQSTDDADTESRAIAMLALEQPVIAQPHDSFVVRMSDETIFGGEVIIRDRPRWMKRADLISLGERLLKSNLEEAVLQFVAAAPHQMVRASYVHLFLSNDVMVSNLIEQKKVAKLGEILMSPEVRQQLSQRMADTLKKLGSNVGADQGVALEIVRTSMTPKLERSTFQSLVEEELQRGTIVRKGDRLGLPGVQAKPADPAASKLQQDIMTALADNFCLDLNELARATNTDAKKVKATVQELSKNGSVHLVNYDFAISSSNLKQAHQVLSDLWNTKRSIAPTDFKEKLNITRKYAMALLQHFDDNKITRRLESGRVLLKAP